MEEQETGQPEPEDSTPEAPETPTATVPAPTPGDDLVNWGGLVIQEE